jgi:hypothetical protein
MHYLDALPVSVGPAAVFKVVIRIPGGEGRVAYPLRREMGETTTTNARTQPRGNRTGRLVAVFD